MFWDLPKKQIHVYLYPQQILAILVRPPFQGSETEIQQKCSTIKNYVLSCFLHLQILKSVFSPSLKISQHALKILNKFKFSSLLFLLHYKKIGAVSYSLNSKINILIPLS